MKKIYLLSLAGLLLSAIGNAQTPENKSVALVTKQTGTWCVNCGTWGWDMGHNLYTSVTNSGKGIFMAVYDNSGGLYGSPDLVVQADNVFNSNYNTTGVPCFYVNGLKDPTNSDQTWGSYTDENVALAKVDAFVATAPVVSSAAYDTIVGNQISSTANAKFWLDATGDYYMGSYIVEDSVLAPQYPLTQPSDPSAVHVGVLRASMSSTFWGESIGSGSVAANTTASKTFSATLDASWNVNHLRVFTVIWKKNGSQYEFVNAAITTYGRPTGLEDIVDANSLLLYPNPAKDNVTLTLDSKSLMKLNLNVIDETGRSVYNQDVQATKGNNTFSISLNNIASGMYKLVLSGENGKISKNLSVVK